MNTDSTTYISDIGQLIEANDIPYSFDTLGWKIVALVLILLFCISIILWWQHYKKNAYRRNAISNINSWVEHKAEEAPYLINLMIKKLCINLYGRRKVASLYGEEWFAFLSKNCNYTAITKTESAQYTQAIYNTAYTMSPQELNNYKIFMLYWAKKHTTNV